MDRYEFKVRLEEINSNIQAGTLLKAAAIADKIDWNRVKSYSTLVDIINLYEEIGRLEEARNLCVIAYNKKLGGRMLVYKLAELNIRLKDFEEAEELYEEFVERSPNDISRYSLKYQLEVAKGAPAESLIALLEEYKKYDQDEGCSYELACLYDKAGMADKCISECNELLLWFNGGDYYEDTLRLKDKYGLLTPAQKKQLNDFEEARLNKFETKPVELTNPEDIKISVPDYNLYDTRNIQHAIAKNMSAIIAEAQKEEEDAKQKDAAKVVEKEIQQPTQLFERIQEARKAIEEEMQHDPDQVENQMDIFDWLGEAAIKEPEITKVILKPGEVLPVIQNEKAEEKVESAEVAESEEVAKAVEKPIEVTEAEKLEETIEAAKIEVTEETEITIEEAVEQKEEQAMVEEPVIYKELEELEESVIKETAMEDIFAVQEENVSKDTPKESESWKEKIDFYVDRDKDTTQEIGEIIAKSLHVLSMQNEEDQVSIDLEDVDNDNEYEDIITPEETIEETVEETAEETLEDVVETVDKEAEETIEAVGKEAVEEILPASNQVEEKAISEIDLLKETVVETIELEEGQSDKQVTEEIELVTATNIELGLSKEEHEPIEEDIEEYLNKYFSAYIQDEDIKYQLVQVLREYRDGQKDNTSKRGNIVVTGNKSAEKTDIALNIVKCFNVINPDKKRKIAKITGDGINSRGIAKAMPKLKGSVLIVDNAAMLDEEHIAELTDVMQQDTENMVVILIDGKEELLKMLNENPALDEMMTSKVFVKKYSVNELVDFAKSYAYDCRCTIDDKALLHLYLKIDAIHSQDSLEDEDLVKEIIDKAIEKAKKRSGKKLFGFVKTKQADDNSVILKESDFK